MVPRPPEEMKLRVFTNREYLAAVIWFWPTSVTTMAPESDASATLATTSPMLMLPDSGRTSGATTFSSSTLS